MDLANTLDVYIERGDTASSSQFADYYISEEDSSGSSLFITNKVASPAYGAKNNVNMSIENTSVQVSRSNTVLLTEHENNALDYAFRNSVKKISKGRLVETS